MTRDMDLIRKLLLKIEAMPIRPGTVENIYFSEPEMLVDGHTPDDVAYNFNLLVQADYVAAPPSKLRLAGGASFSGLTWQGHEFLDSIRSPEVWNFTKAAFKKVGGFGLDIAFQIAKAETKRIAAEKLGIAIP